MTFMKTMPTSATAENKKLPWRVVQGARGPMQLHRMHRLKIGPVAMVPTCRIRLREKYVFIVWIRILGNTLFWATITGSIFAAGCLRNLLPGSAPISLQWFMLVLIIQQIFVKPQQWPAPSESIAIYCVRKLVSCVTHLQSCAKVDIWNKKKNYALLLRSKLKITKIEDYRIWAQLQLHNCTIAQHNCNLLSPWRFQFHC